MEQRTPSSSARGTLLGLFLLLSLTAVPQPAHAIGLGSLAPKLVIDPAHIAVSKIINKVTSGVNLKEYVLDPAAYSVGKVALHSLTKSVVNWINSGFNGSPAFVQDLNSTLLQIGDAEAQRFATEFQNNEGLANVPWKDDIAQSVLTNYFRNTSNDGFYLNNPYTLDQISSDPQAFVRGDYSKGGLDAWMSVVLNPGNNPLALFQNTQNELSGRVAKKKGTEQTYLNWSGGFLSYRGDCKQLNTPVASSVLNFANSASGGTGAIASLNQAAQDCTDKPILTPGAVIADAANKYIVEQGADEYIAADEIGEVINVLLGQLIGNVLGSGGLAGVSKPSSGGGSSYIDRATSASAEPSAGQFDLSTQFLTTVGQQIITLTQYKDDWQKIAAAATAAQKAVSGTVPGTTCSIVETILSTSQSEVGNVTSILTQLNDIKNKLTTSVATNPTAQQTVVGEATATFQSVQAQAGYPSSADISYVSQESEDRNADTELSVPASLYTQMVDISTTGTCPT